MGVQENACAETDASHVVESLTDITRRQNQYARPLSNIVARRNNTLRDRIRSRQTRFCLCRFSDATAQFSNEVFISERTFCSTMCKFARLGQPKPEIHEILPRKIDEYESATSKRHQNSISK